METQKTKKLHYEKWTVAKTKDDLLNGRKYLNTIQLNDRPRAN